MRNARLILFSCFLCLTVMVGAGFFAAVGFAANETDEMGEAVAGDADATGPGVVDLSTIRVEDYTVRQSVGPLPFSDKKTVPAPEQKPSPKSGETQPSVPAKVTPTVPKKSESIPAVPQKKQKKEAASDKETSEEKAESSPEKPAISAEKRGERSAIPVLTSAADGFILSIDIGQPAEFKTWKVPGNPVYVIDVQGNWQIDGNRSFQVNGTKPGQVEKIRLGENPGFLRIALDYKDGMLLPEVYATTQGLTVVYQDK